MEKITKWLNDKMNKWTNHQMNKWTIKQMTKWTANQMNSLSNEWWNEQMSKNVLLNIIPKWTKWTNAHRLDIILNLLTNEHNE